MRYIIRALYYRGPANSSTCTNQRVRLELRNEGYMQSFSERKKNGKKHCPRKQFCAKYYCCFAVLCSSTDPLSGIARMNKRESKIAILSFATICTALTLINGDCIHNCVTFKGTAERRSTLSHLFGAKSQLA